MSSRHSEQEDDSFNRKRQSQTQDERLPALSGDRTGETREHQQKQNAQGYLLRQILLQLYIWELTRTLNVTPNLNHPVIAATSQM